MVLENVQVLIITDLVNKFYWARTAGSYRIATQVRDAGYSCQVIDCFTSFTEEEMYKIFDRVIGDKTMIVGLSSTFFANIDNPGLVKSPTKNSQKDFAGYSNNYPFNLERMNRYFDYIKKINPKVKIVLGGHKAAMLDAPGTDVFITGMGDTAIIEYLKYLENKNPFLQYTVIPETKQIVLDGDKHNARFDFNNSMIVYKPEDNIHHNEVAVLEVGRGCIFKCSFCSYPLNGKKKNDYIKNAAPLREELIRNYEEHGIKHYVYSDDTHNDNLDKLRALAEIVQSLPFKLEYTAYLRLDLIHAHPEQYQLLKDGGLKGAFFGIESLNHQATKTIGKGLHPDKIIEELYRFQDLMPHVGTEGGFICGLPHETKESVMEWVDRILEKEFPLDNFQIEPLYINRSPWRIYKSEFEKNSKEYYTFKEDSYEYWHNGHFDKDWAIEYCSYIYKERRTMDRIRLGGWMCSMMHNFDIGKDLTKIPLSQVGFKWSEFRNMPRQRYKDKVISSL